MITDQTADVRAKREALAIAHGRLRAELNSVRSLAGRGNIPAARMLLDDARSDLDEIQRLTDELDELERAERAAVAAKVTPEMSCHVCGVKAGERCLNTVTGLPMDTVVHGGRTARWENELRDA